MLWRPISATWMSYTHTQPYEATKYNTFTSIHHAQFTTLRSCWTPVTFFWIISGNFSEAYGRIGGCVANTQCAGIYSNCNPDTLLCECIDGYFANKHGVCESGENVHFICASKQVLHVYMWSFGVFGLFVFMWLHSTLQHSFEHCYMPCHAWCQRDSVMCTIHLLNLRKVTTCWQHKTCDKGKWTYRAPCTQGKQVLKTPIRHYCFACKSRKIRLTKLLKSWEDSLFAEVDGK